MNFEAVYPECVACSGVLEERFVTRDSEMRICAECDGRHTVTTVENYNRISKGMELIDADFDNTVYFDLSGVDASGKTVKRCHGWMKIGMGYAGIVQFG